MNNCNDVGLTFYDVPHQVQKFDDTLVALVQTATSPTEYSLLATPLLAEVKNLQHLFQFPV
ncbi:MAG: hypothetical protein ACM65L_05950 [Microcoleus sp.]|uniref:hypothetical protein n=1 Tax=Microcoleus sp. CAWBG640 TaxID=2841653 RepID=UPI00312BAFE0